MSAENQRKAYRYNCNMVRPQIYSEKSLMESVVDFFSDVVPQAYSSQKVEDKEKIQWVRFENCDCCDIGRNPDLYKYDTKGLPLLLILGYSNGVQIWNITPNGEALEILSVRQGPVKICRILPNPEPVLGYTDSFTSKRPLVVMCDSSSAGQPFCGMKFVSLKTGDEVHSVSFKTLPIHNIECNKRFLVVTFLEKICIYESCRFKQLFWITSCFPASAPNVNPIALSSRWLAYADKRLVAMHQSCGGMSGDGTQSYAATVISAAKGAFKGLSMFGEAMVNSVTGCKPTGSKKQQEYVQLDNGNRPGIVSVVDIQNVHNDHFNVNEDNEGSGLIAHFHAHANESVADMAFDPTGTLLVTACKLGHNFHIFRLMAHPCSSSLGAVHHLYTLHRGDTTAKVIDIGFNHDSRWVTVSTHRGTTHIFAITPYGGIPNVRTHCQPFVVNRASRFHRSAGLEDIEHSPLGRRSPVLSTSPSSSGHYDRYPTLIQQNTLNNNMGNPRLPPYPHPITVYPLYQIKQPLNVVLNPGNKNMSPNHSPTGLDNVFSVASRFCTPRLCVIGSPKLDVERREAGKRSVDCLFIMAQSGSLVEYVLEPKARTVSEKVSDESLLELNVVGRMQWNLQRLKTSLELRPPLPTNSPIILSHEAVISQTPTPPEYYDLPGLTRHDSKDSLSSDHSGKDEDEWVSQVEIITHAGPHRRLWMGPQFSFKTYHENTTVLSSNSSALLSQSPDTNMVAMDITGEEGDLESLRVQPTRSNPVSMPNARPAYRRLSSDSSPSPGLSGHSAPLLIEAGSFDQSPHLLDVYSNWTESTVEKQPRGGDDVEEDRIKETLADAMVESPMRDMEKLSLRQDITRANMRKVMTKTGEKKAVIKKDTRMLQGFADIKDRKAEKQIDERQDKERRAASQTDCNKVRKDDKGRKDALDKNVCESKSRTKQESNSSKAEENQSPVRKQEASKQYVTSVAKEIQSKPKEETQIKLKPSGSDGFVDQSESDMKGKGNAKSSKKKNKSKGDPKPNVTNAKSDKSPPKEVTMQQQNVVEKSKSTPSPPKEQITQEQVNLKPKKDSNLNGSKENISSKNEAPMKENEPDEHPQREIRSDKQDEPQAKSKLKTDQQKQNKSKTKYEEAVKIKSTKSPPKEIKPLMKKSQMMPANTIQNSEKETNASNLDEQLVQGPKKSPESLPKEEINLEQVPTIDQDVDTSNAKCAINVDNSNNVEHVVENDIALENYANTEMKESCNLNESNTCDIESIEIKSETIGSVSKGIYDVSISSEVNSKNTNIKAECSNGSKSPGIYEVERINTKKQKRGKDKKKSMTNSMIESQILQINNLQGQTRIKPEVEELIITKEKENDDVLLQINGVENEQMETLEIMPDNISSHENEHEGHSEKNDTLGTNTDKSDTNLVKEDIDYSAWCTPDKKKRKTKKKGKDTESINIEDPTNEIMDIKDISLMDKEGSISPPVSGDKYVYPENCGKERNDVVVGERIHETAEIKAEIPVTNTGDENIVETGQTDNLSEKKDKEIAQNVEEEIQTNSGILSPDANKTTASGKSENDKAYDTVSKTDVKGKNKQKKKKKGARSDSFDDKTRSATIMHNSYIEKKSPKEEEPPATLEETETKILDTEIFSSQMQNVIKMVDTKESGEDELKFVDALVSKDKPCLVLDLAAERADNLERSPSYESVRSTLSEERQLSKNDGTDSEVLASTEHSDNDMMEIKNKKKKKKKKINIEDSVYFEATEPSYPFEDNQSQSPVELNGSPSDPSISTTDMSNTDIGTKKNEIIEENIDNFPTVTEEMPGKTDSSNFDPLQETVNDDTDMFVMKSKKSRKNKKSQSLKSNSDQGGKPEIRETLTTDDIPSSVVQSESSTNEIDAEVTPVNSEMSTKMQAVSKNSNVSKVVEDPTAWETAASITSDKSQTNFEAVKVNDLKNSGTDSKQDKILPQGNDTISPLKEDKVSMETPETSNSSSRSSEERDVPKGDKTKEIQGESKNKKKRKKNRK